MPARLLRTMPSAPRSARPAQPLQRLTDKLLAGELGPVASALLCAVSPTSRRCLRLWREAEQASLASAKAVAAAAVAVAAQRWRVEDDMDVVDAEFWAIVATV
ncbi:hypothetical protein [Motilibacter deserti]|uniref:Uncharacterized protein n=1 Tax=Motilibacter deserti TaxID=2714956 RepID=A0ABX0H0S3_9ACTN|nr:hypothetical protein [Motilibacter deserti]NHC15570.1 hypothetical protein [Motilibacter deserti]